MLSGKIAGHVWSSKKLESMPAGALVIVDLDNDGGRLIAFDPLACGEGEPVLIATGSACTRHFATQTPIDALVIASLE